MDEKQAIGKVVLAGAGPGDAELISVKLMRCLGTADVILTDRLVNPDIIARYANAAAEVISTGKQGFNESSMSQQEINELILHHALAGKMVLRLKGGDVAFFSNVLDELQAIAIHQVPFEIIPGITAASGASAYAGIPLTARGYAQGVQVLTFNPNTYYSSERWKQLANSNDTLVFYMAAKNCIGLAEVLGRYSRRPATPMAVIEQATTVYQHVHITTLKDCAVDFAGKVFASPSIIIIGDVVRLHHDFGWFAANEEGSVFKPLSTDK